MSSSPAALADSADVQLKSFGRKAELFAYRHPRQDPRITILHGAVRSSKTWSCIPKIFFLCDYQVGGVGVITGVSKQTIYNNVLRDLFNIIGPQNYTYNRMSGQLSLFGTEWVVIGAKDEGSEKYVRGLSVGKAIGDELTLLPRSFVMMLLNRMSPEGARAYFTTNPDSPFHYVKTDLIDNQKLVADRELRVIHFTLDDNPNLSESYKQYLNTLYSGVFRQRFIEGLWVMAEGAIYRDSFSDVLLYDDDTRPSGLLVRGTYPERYVAVDYGTDHPQVYLDIIDDGSKLWIEREYVWDSHAEKFASGSVNRWIPRDSHTMPTLTQKTDAQYADDLEVFLTARWHAQNNCWMAGPTTGAIDAQVILPPECASFEAELRRRGIWYCVAKNDVLDGIRTVSTLMNLRMLRIHKDNCPRLVAELQTYSWDAKAAQHGEERPIKTQDDTCDALRYGAFTKVAPWRLERPN